jgi:hypothetical protein
MRRAASHFRDGLESSDVLGAADTLLQVGFINQWQASAGQLRGLHVLRDKHRLVRTELADPSRFPGTNASMSSDWVWTAVDHQALVAWAEREHARLRQLAQVECDQLLHASGG